MVRKMMDIIETCLFLMVVCGVTFVVLTKPYEYKNFKAYKKGVFKDE